MWVKGQPRPAVARRRKGSVNKATREYKEFLRGLVDNPDYRDKLEAMFVSGAILQSPHLLATVTAHAIGKPVPAQPPADSRSPLLFVTTHSIGSYDPRAEKAATLLERKAERALPAPTGSYHPPEPGDPDALVVVEEPGTLAAARLMGPATR